ncbi:unnamed protein product [Thlaspi arvense]|uniref:H15 domain-containing protein n=1 Tax=Thlaspi arvense TaxID=13288 RepID=A0AAU9S1Z2_THLAR|nr:unnamed protein product [Thlaspi arvense]
MDPVSDDPNKLSDCFPLSQYHAHVVSNNIRNRALAAGGAPLPPDASSNCPPYPQMIRAAIADLNEPDGSSKIAISRHIERSLYTLPANHGSVLSHHLKVMKKSGALVMVRKSYKLASGGPDAPRSVITPVQASASQPQKRGRGRPPKPKPQAQPQPITVQSNGQSVTRPTGEVTESGKRRPGRPRKDGSAPIVQAAAMAGIMKRRGRPPGRRAAGRQRKPKSVSATASVFPSYDANGARRAGRPRSAESSGTVAAAPAGGEAVAVAPGMKRGRGRPPKIGGVMNRIIAKPSRGRGRPAGRPRKNITVAQEPAYGELKKKLDLFKEKAVEIFNMLTAGGDQSVAQARKELEVLIQMEEVQPAPQPQGEERGEGELGQALALALAQTEEMAMPEACVEE